MRVADQYRFSVQPEPGDTADSVLVVCERCGHASRCAGIAMLADLIDAADEHAEVCR